MKSGIGQPVRRKEDIRLVTGSGRFTDDIALENQAFAHFVRSPQAHAKIATIDASAALKIKGVIGVLTGSDLAPLDLGHITTSGKYINWKGSELPEAPKMLLPTDKVRFVGEAVAMVVADTAALAKDAAEQIQIAYEPLPAAGTLDAAAMGQGSALWDRAPNNRAFEWISGDEKACATAFANSAHVVSIDVEQNKLTACAIEPRAALGVYDATREYFTLYVPCQGVSNLRDRLAEGLLKIPRERLRVVAPDVGGGFGMKAQLYPEQALVLLAARQFGRPVKWCAERSEAFLADTQARDAKTHGELALDADGRILAARVSGIATIGAYFSRIGPQVPTAAGMRIFGGVYRVPVAHVKIEGYFTNSMSIAPYRGAGRPEAAYLMDRLMDKAAAATGLDRLEIRRRNLIRQEELPYKNWAGFSYDSGDFPQALADTAKHADWDGFAERRSASARRGKRRGLGVCYYVELAGGNPGKEPSAVRFTQNGAIEVYLGTQSTGQGHETAFAQIVSEQLGVPFESVIIKEGDTQDGVLGMGSVGSRSTQTAGNSIGVTVMEVLRKGKLAASQILQAGGKDVDFAVEDGVGRFHVAGSDRRIGIAELALAMKREILPEFENGLDSAADYSCLLTFPNGCHVCEVEVDEETGEINVDRYHVVDDFGRVINPLLAEGQVHGGVAQGLGQVLMEHCIYDGDSGQLMTASFMDYALPRASDVPFVEAVYNEVLCATNPLGCKGAGEGGTVGALPAIVGAIADALNVAHIDMPVTAEKAWRALRSGK